jgi:hypothetical protein
MEDKPQSEFGAGLVYPIGLFLMHTERDFLPEETAKKIYGENWENKNWSMWWYAAADHLFELEIPDFLPKTLQQKIKDLQNLAMTYRLPMGDDKPDNKVQAQNALKMAKEILFECDKYMGLKPIKGEYE